MKIATRIIAFLFGAMFVFASLSYFFMTTPPPMPSGAMKTFMEGVLATGYLMQLVKVTELVCGVAYLIGRFIPLANLVILPITVNIFMVHAFMEASGLPIAVAMLTVNIFLIYAYRSHYSAVFAAK